MLGCGIRMASEGRLVDEHTRGNASVGEALRLHLGDGFIPSTLEDEKQCILVLIGATPEGRRNCRLHDGARESAQGLARSCCST